MPTSFTAYPSQPPTPTTQDSTASPSPTPSASTSSDSGLRAAQAPHATYWFGWAHLLSSCAIPTAQPLPFTNDDFANFRQLGSSIERSDPFSTPNSFIGPKAPHGYTAGPLASFEKSAMSAGAPPGL